jgi:predicted enzyme related to lactoylglutathione lyase
MPRVIHFEIPAENPDRATKFYREVFGWEIQKWAGPMEYWLATTGADGQPGINGGLMRREAPYTGTTNTIDVASVDTAIQTVQAKGGKLAIPKMAVPGIGYIAYCQDTEGNLFGMLQADANAK